jgi:DNA-binding SARP family transcriptional activator
MDPITTTTHATRQSAMKDPHSRAGRCTTDKQVAQHSLACAGVGTSTSSSRRCSLSQADVTITCLGTLLIARDGTPVTDWRNRKARELLAYLAAHHTGDGRFGVARKSVQAALWPQAEPLTGQALLRTALWRLRALVDGPPHKGATKASGMVLSGCASSIVLTQGDRLSLNDARCVSDLAGLRRSHANLLARASHSAGNPWTEPPAHGAVTGDVNPATSPARDVEDLAGEWLQLAEDASRPVLAGESFPWLAAARREVRELCLDALDRARRYAEEATALELALRAVNQHLALDPLHEPTVGAALRLHLARGDTALALTRYRTYCLALARRYGPSDPALAVPSVELKSLASAAIGTSVVNLPTGHHESGRDPVRSQSSDPDASDWTSRSARAPPRRASRGCVDASDGGDTPHTATTPSPPDVIASLSP